VFGIFRNLFLFALRYVDYAFIEIKVYKYTLLTVGGSFTDTYLLTYSLTHSFTHIFAYRTPWRAHSLTCLIRTVSGADCLLEIEE
jgi:hypothetical protein